MRHQAARILAPLTAFAHDLGLRRKRPRIENAQHLKFIRSLPCLVPGCSRRDVEAAHIRMASPAYGKRHTGLAEKPADHWVLPLCLGHHAMQHKVGEQEFWTWASVDPFPVALALFACSGDEDAGDLIIREAKRR